MEQLEMTPVHTAPAKKDLLGGVLFWLAALALALAPTQMIVSIKGIPLAPAEVVLLLAALVWVVRWILVRDTHSLPPLVNWLLVIAGALSVIGLLTDPQTMQTPGVRKAFAMDLAKLVLYFLILYTIFRAVFTTPQRVRTAVIALLATTTLAVGLAVVQRVQLQSQFQPDPLQRHTFILEEDKDAVENDEDFTEQVKAVESRYAPEAYTTIETPIEVSSTFGSWDSHGYHPSRTAYAGFLALVLPFALAFLATARRKAGAIVWIALLLLGVGISVLAGYIMPAILIGLMVTGVAMGAKTGRLVLAGVAAYLLLLVVLGGHNRREVVQEPYQVKVSAEEAKFRYFDEETGTAVAHLKKFWGEQQAALNLLRSDPRNNPPDDPGLTHRNPLFGVGMGQYQAKINFSFGTLGPVSSQRLESDAQNGYLLNAVNMGLLGLAALLALFGTGIGQAWRMVRAGFARPWTAAMLGSIIALTVMTLFMNSLVRGNLVVIVALLAMIGSFAAQHKTEEATPLQEEQKDGQS